MAGQQPTRVLQATARAIPAPGGGLHPERQCCLCNELWANESVGRANGLDLSTSAVIIATIPVIDAGGNLANPCEIALSADGRRLHLATQSSIGKVVVLDTSTFAQIGLITVGENQQGVACKN